MHFLSFRSHHHSKHSSSHLCIASQHSGLALARQSAWHMYYVINKSCGEAPSQHHALRHQQVVQPAFTAGHGAQVGRTAVRESRLVHVSTLTEEDVAGGCQADFLGNLLGKLIGTMQFWAHGRYLLSHAPGADVIACFRELPKQHVPVCGS